MVFIHTCRFLPNFIFAKIRQKFLRTLLLVLLLRIEWACRLVLCEFSGKYFAKYFEFQTF